MQFLLTRISTRAVVMLVPSNKPLQNVEKCLRSDESQQRRRGYGRNYARHIKADGLKLSLMIGGLSRLCYGRRIQKRFTQHYAETDVSSMSYHGSAPFFPFSVKKISYRAVMVNDPTPAV